MQDLKIVFKEFGLQLGFMKECCFLEVDCSSTIYYGLFLVLDLEDLVRFSW